MAQERPSGWPRAGDRPPTASTAPQTDPAQQTEAQDPAQPQADRPASDAYGQPAAAPQSQTPAQASRPAYGVPSQLTLRPGTYVTVRINQPLSTDHNHVGDTFSANLMAPVIVDGIIVANRGQMAYGRVAEVQKQHADNPSRLGLELTGITLADGTQAPITSQLVAQQGGTTPGAVQAGTIVGTTAVGAAVGGIAARGAGAAIGAGAGAAAGIVGVLLTRHHATVLYPETALTFQVTSPVMISTANSPQAFRFVGSQDYNRPATNYSYSERPAPPVRPAPVPAPYYYGGYDPYYYPGYYPYYYGPSVVIGGGWGWGWGGGWGRGWGGGWGRGFGGGFRGRR
jgi:hypothetical protein